MTPRNRLTAPSTHKIQLKKYAVSHIPQLLVQIEDKRMPLHRRISILFFVSQSFMDEVLGVLFDLPTGGYVFRGCVEVAEIGETQTESGD
ncbi:uncharacterized protein EAF01_004748 [Botrytis porri]|uniref:uncharacterized protein n=1 Tax=Botrytis porri TaxID=87229 RepID=UPI001901C378|nr:uncharacterized protein EAF01_004748 [Botrytis porri]KAF7907161.1 hypothetical protein EAF01_004748 [Botrytis porri]